MVQPSKLSGKTKNCAFDISNVHQTQLYKLCEQNPNPIKPFSTPCQDTANDTFRIEIKQ